MHFHCVHRYTHTYGQQFAWKAIGLKAPAIYVRFNKLKKINCFRSFCNNFSFCLFRIFGYTPSDKCVHIYIYIYMFIRPCIAEFLYLYIGFQSHRTTKVHAGNLAPKFLRKYLLFPHLVVAGWEAWSPIGSRWFFSY